MKIYEELNDGSIQVREMIIDSEKARKYKIDEMSSIPSGKRVFNASSTDEERELAPDKTSYYHNLDYVICGVWGGYFYHKIQFFEDMNLKEQTEALNALNDYYSGTRENGGIAKVLGFNSLFPLKPQYILLGAKEYDVLGKMKNNIVVPESLMKLQRFEDGDLSYADSQIVSLYDISDPLENSKVSKELFENWLTLLREGQPINPKNPGFGVSEEEVFWLLLDLGLSVDAYEKVKQSGNIFKLKK